MLHEVKPEISMGGIELVKDVTLAAGSYTIHCGTENPNAKNSNGFIKLLLQTRKVFCMGWHH